MSLIALLRSPFRNNIREWFCDNFPKPILMNKSRILVKLNEQYNDYTGEIGTAFDYLMRFELERRNKNLVQRKPWIAEIGYNRILNRINSFVGEEIYIGYCSTTLIKKSLLRKYLEKLFLKAKENHSLFLKEGILTTALLESCLFLAKLDAMVRVGVIDANMHVFQKTKIEQLIMLLKQFRGMNL